MHFVAALDAVPEMRGVLCLFEGVATGAADGYGRMTGRPAAALLHLGPGLANGLANLHNARRAHTPLLAVVGDHATYHKRMTRRWNRTSTPWPAGCPSGRAARPAAPTWLRTPPRRWRRRWPRPAGSRPSSCPPTCPGPRAASPRPRSRRAVSGACARGRDRVRRGGAAQRGAVRDPARRGGHAAAGPGRGQPDRPGHRRPSCWVRRFPPGSSAARASPRSTGWPTWPSSRWPRSPAPAT